MLGVIATIESPIIHFKIFGGGNKPIRQAFETLGRSMRPNHVACIGVFPKDDPDILARDVALFQRHAAG